MSIDYYINSDCHHPVSLAPSIMLRANTLFVWGVTVVVQPVKDTKFDEYLEYPCPFTFRIMGLANVNLTDQILAKLQPIAPGDYAPKVKPSSKGNYESVSLVATVTSGKHIEEIYNVISNIDDVRHML